MAQAALPETPHQHDPWTPAAVEGIPDYVVKTSEVLFDAGLADPRGGEYREIELAGSGIKTHGWVFENRYVVCWNGLVYYTRGVGGAADLNQDVRAIANLKRWGPFINDPPPEAEFWAKVESLDSRAPVSIALLLRLGKSQLVSQLWAMPYWNNIRGDIRSERAWLDTSMYAWLGTAFHRLIAERGRGDDEGAVSTGESLLVWRSHLPASLRSRDVSFLTPVSVLLADSQRRTHEPERSPPQSPSQSEWISDLIDRLEDVKGEKITIPGRLEFLGDPVCEALVKEGSAAVEPLLNAYERDQRLTRAVDYTRPWYLERRPVPVHEVIPEILSAILQVPSVVASSNPAELRAWWQKHNQADPIERSFGILASDTSTPEEWVEAAKTITLRSDIERLGPGWMQLPKDGCAPDRPVPAPAGEALRTRTNPSVSDLLAKRATSAATRQPKLTCDLAFMAYSWDAVAGRAVLQFARHLDACRGDSLVTAARLESGDLQAASDWMPAIQRRASTVGFMTSELLPLWLFPDNPVLNQTAERLFSQPDAPLNPGKEYVRANSPLLATPAYQRAVLASLEDATLVGTATRERGAISYRLSTGGGGGGMAEPSDPSDSKQAAPGEERPVRTKDLVAWILSGVSGFPRFKLDWPEDDKDAAAEAIAQFLRNHAGDLRASPARLKDAVCLQESVHLVQ